LLIVLLDADVIIDLHKFEVWEHIIKQNEILISSTILRREVYYYVDDFGFKHNIDLVKEAGRSFAEVSVKAEDLISFKQKFERFILEELDPGELESLKILDDREDCSFSTCDKAAIKVIALLGKREKGLSFEKLLKSSGISKNLEYKHTEHYFKKYLDEGSILRIQRFGLKEE